MVKRKVSWTARASKQFNEAVDYIRQDSFQNSEAFKEKILSDSARLSDIVAIHRKDQYKNNNDGHFYYFELLNYRISYYKDDHDIIIVRMRHVSMRPKNY